MKKDYHIMLSQGCGDRVNEIRGYFERHGFKLTDDVPGKLLFTMKTTFRNFFSRDSLQGGSQVMVIRKGNELYAYAHIPTFTKRMSPAKERAWSLFFSALKEELASMLPAEGFGH